MERKSEDAGCVEGRLEQIKVPTHTPLGHGAAQQMAREKWDH